MISDAPGPPPQADGIHGMLPRDQMPPAVRKLRDFYACKPGAPFCQREFAFLCLDRWKADGVELDKMNLAEVFGFDPPAAATLFGGTFYFEPPFLPRFEEKVLEDRGDTELVQTGDGQQVVYFKGRRSGFMPTFEKSPVTDWKSWEENCKWRLNADDPRRWENMAERVAKVVDDAKKGFVVTQAMLGGYMYLRMLMGPEGLMYIMLEQPELVHDCMQTWLRLMDAVTAHHQVYVSFDVLFMGEDICYNHGLLISPAQMREFLLPYYQQLIANIKSRQRDKKRHLHVQLDTDGDCRPAIPIYQEIGMDSLFPFEVASGCDVVEIGLKHPGLAMSGGIDKRILAEGPEAIDRHLDYILPAMHKRGGYAPTCDHAVPAEVSFENYLHYRKRCLEYNG